MNSANRSDPPTVIEHDGIRVVRDDLFAGGSKARFAAALFDGVDEVVYASPPEGGAQTALAHAARQVRKQATIFVAQRHNPHPRSIAAKASGARVFQVKPGHLVVVQARARAYAARFGARLAPFGLDTPEAAAALRDAALQTRLEPDEVWCAAGSGVLTRALGLAWPRARRFAVEVGRALSPADVGGAEIIRATMPFAQRCPVKPPFPSDLHYDAKAWRECKARRGAGLVLFWNVTGPA